MTTNNRPATETDELREILAEFNVHRELETTGRCVCGGEWPCPDWADQMAAARTDEQLWASEWALDVDGDLFPYESEAQARDSREFGTRGHLFHRTVTSWQESK
jgi:hypothetical protein